MRALIGRISSKQFLLRSVLPSLVFILFTAVAVYAAGHGEAEGHDHHKLIDFGWRVLNVGIILGALYYFSARAIKGFFGGRRDAIKASMEDAIADKEDAQKKFDEYSAKLDKATDEIEGISKMIQEQGLAEKEKIIEDAKKTAEKMKVDTQARMEQEFKKMRNELRVEAAELAVQMAEAILEKQVEKTDHDVMVKDFIDRMVRLN